jgi:hypothetical protein
MQQRNATDAIIAVVDARKSRGATLDDIAGYLKHLREETWKNSPGMVEFIKEFECKNHL